MNEDKLLIRIAEMYYQENKNQSEISKALNIHRSTISRLLKKSREEGIVQIKINYDKDESYELEKQFLDRFQLKKIIIVRSAKEMKEEQKKVAIAQAADEYLSSILEDNQVIGFSWGSMLSTFANHIKPKQTEAILCVPMIGGPAGKLSSDFHVNTITYEAAKKLNGKALLIDAPAFPESEEMKAALLKNDFNQELVAIWKKMDIAIFGIGSPNLSGEQTWMDFYGEDILQSLTQQEVVGDVISRFYNSQGEHISSVLDNEIIGTDISDLIKIETRIGLAESVEKARAILGALRGNYINVLVTTEETAREMLKIDDN